MVSAQCTNRTITGSCRKTEEGFFSEIRDRKEVLFPVRAECAYCYNVIYNSVPLCLFKEMEEITKTELSAVRLDFTVENADTASKITEGFLNGDGERIDRMINSYTKGHFRKGVE